MFRRSKILEMESNKGATSIPVKSHFQAAGTSNDGENDGGNESIQDAVDVISTSELNNPAIPNIVDNITCDISKVQLNESANDKRSVKLATKCRNCSCDIKMEQATGITDECPGPLGPASSSAITTVTSTNTNTNTNTNVNAISVPIANESATSTTVNMPLFADRHPTNPTYLPPHFRNMPKTQSLDLADERNDEAHGMSTSTSSDLPGMLPRMHPFDQNRPIYPNVPYSPYGSPFGSPRSGRRRPPLRESRRISIEQSGSFLQLNQYKLMDQIGQVNQLIISKIIIVI